jgi:hypothetical protein
VIFVAPQAELTAGVENAMALGKEPPTNGEPGTDVRAPVAPLILKPEIWFEFRSAT